MDGGRRGNTEFYAAGRSRRRGMGNETMRAKKKIKKKIKNGREKEGKKSDSDQIKEFFFLLTRRNRLFFS